MKLQRAIRAHRLSFCATIAFRTLGLPFTVDREEFKLLWVVVVLSLNCLLTVPGAVFRISNWLDCFPYCHACSPRTRSPFYVCGRFTFRSLVASRLATLWADSEFTGRLCIKLPGC